MAKRISVINFKGGVGKTTLAYHLAYGLAHDYAEKVLLVDMDHQSSLSVVCLGVERWESVSESGNTVSKVFLSFVDGTRELPGREIIMDKPHWHIYPASNPEVSLLNVVPASLDLDGIEIEMGMTHQGNPIRSEWNKRTLACRWIEETGIDDEYGYIIFDCPPATKIVAQNAIAASHGYIVPVIPEAVMQRGVSALVNTISDIDGILDAYSKLSKRERRGREIWVPDTQLVGLAVTWIQGHASESGWTDDHTQHISALEEYAESDLGQELLKPYIPRTTLVSQALAANGPVSNLPESVLTDPERMLKIAGTYDDWERIDVFYEELVEEIKSRIDGL